MDDTELAKLEGTLRGVDDEYRRRMNALAKDLSEAFKAARQLTSHVAAVSQMLAKIDWPDLIARIEESSGRLARLGWTLPMTLTPSDLVELAEQCTTDVQVERYMLEYYTCEDGRFFLDVRKNVLRKGTLRRWRVLLEQCFDAYDRTHYLILIPALLSVIEGRVAHKADRLREPVVNPRRLAMDLERAAPHGSIEFLIWRSVRLVIDKLFARSDFAGPHPTEVNRHWILHGRDQTYWTRTDALRLFNLLATIS